MMIGERSLGLLDLLKHGTPGLGAEPDGRQGSRCDRTWTAPGLARSDRHTWMQSWGSIPRQMCSFWVRWVWTQ